MDRGTYETDDRHQARAAPERGVERVLAALLATEGGE